MPLADALAPRNQTLADKIREARETLHAQLFSTRARSQELEFALDVATRFGRELLQSWQQQGAVPANVYTQGGQTQAAPTRSLVNQLG